MSYVAYRENSLVTSGKEILDELGYNAIYLRKPYSYTDKTVSLTHCSRSELTYTGKILFRDPLSHRTMFNFILTDISTSKLERFKLTK